MLRLLSWLIRLPQAPKRVTAQAVELYGWNCAFMGATAASLAWIAVILLALIVAALIRRVRP